MIEVIKQHKQNIVVILNKADTVNYTLSEISLPDGEKIKAHSVSLIEDCRNQTLDLLSSKLKLTELDDVLHSDFLVTRHRHRVLFEECLQCLNNF